MLEKFDHEVGVSHSKEVKVIQVPAANKKLQFFLLIPLTHEGISPFHITIINRIISKLKL